METRLKTTRRLQKEPSKATKVMRYRYIYINYDYIYITIYLFYKYIIICLYLLNTLLSPKSRSLALGELQGLELELLTVTRDTTEADLKQRRELSRSSGSRTVYADAAPVRCALNGRLLAPWQSYRA